ncbi:MAG: LytTR family DNA-binding domain-containing protein [Pseudomonadota bacterium]
MTAVRAAFVSLTAQRLTFGAVALVALLVVAQPAETGALAWPSRTVYWALHVLLGLAALWLAGELLTRAAPGRTLWTWVLCGLIGTAFAAPGFQALEWLWPLAGDADVDGALDRLAAGSGAGALLAEFLGTLPWVMCGWALINGPLWRDAVSPATAPACPPASGPAAVDAAAVPAPPDDGPPPADAVLPESLRDRLPTRALGDFVSISADLHYLQVVTTTGRFTVLGRLRDAVSELSDIGLQVHRSHWIADAHVERVIRQGSTTVCVLSTGDRVPVSRRRARDVIERFGQGVVHRSAATPPDA